MIELNKLHTDLHTFSLEIVAESVRNLDLLQDAQPTQSQLNRLIAQMTADAAFASKSIVAIQNLNIPIDIDGSISERLQKAQNNTNKLCDRLGFMCRAREGVGRLTRSGIEYTFTEAIATADNLHDILGILRTVVSKPIQSTEELISKFFVA
ncbi:hypothetical protein [Nitrosomonas sp. Nm132]|uniref:hypothetical protein n=1 Tax=Nitrosomonas sp. Nm132 TaxID=1881053 RepID=UPI00088AD9A4|nr:hypothetical protein [Nitrosomonas sp. Nm132]SDG90193.1 hypothetical protein SAMN05428952_100232 [Nitrosomonas sp. Nm132]